MPIVGAACAGRTHCVWSKSSVFGARELLQLQADPIRRRFRFSENSPAGRSHACFAATPINIIPMDTMSKRNHLLASAAAVAAIMLGFAQSAAAADGVINFTGNIVASTCDVSNATDSGTPGSGDGINGAPVFEVDLGTVSTASLDHSDSTHISASRPINLQLDCADVGTLTKVKVYFDAEAGSGLDTTNTNLLKNEGSATGFGIGLYNSDNSLLNLASKEPLLDADLNVTQGSTRANTATASFDLRAGYVRTGTVGAGNVSARLPFTLSYE
jgi:major type 1 subunit fimbrin (pilin)